MCFCLLSRRPFLPDTHCLHLRICISQKSNGCTVAAVLQSAYSICKYIHLNCGTNFKFSQSICSVAATTSFVCLYKYSVQKPSIFQQIISSLEQFPPLNSFCSNNSIHEAKNCHFRQIYFSKINSCHKNHILKHGKLFSEQINYLQAVLSLAGQPHNPIVVVLYLFFCRYLDSCHLFILFPFQLKS